VLEQATAESQPRDIDGDRRMRLKSQVGTRARVCERWLPV